jgi:putative acetyltransferase
MHIQLDDITHPQVLALLQEHLDDMYAWSPPESVHALDVSKLKVPSIAFFTAWECDTLLATGALKRIDVSHAEIKSMRTPKALRGKGAAKAMLAHLLAHARAQGFSRLSLETGTQVQFEPARKLYASAGFTECGPFEGYELDPHSHFMTLTL